MKDLSSFRPSAFRHDKHLLVKCRSRNRNLRCTPEELVRQSVLGYLLDSKGWSASSIELERGIYFADGSRGRADILLLDSKGAPSVVIECKERTILLGEDVKRQAIRYAQVLRARAVWITNGVENQFFQKVRAGTWEAVGTLPFLEEQHPLPIVIRAPSSTRELSRFNLSGLHSRKLREFATCLLNIIFSPPAFFKLPWGYRGIHLLEDRGISQLSIGTPGGSWNSSYRLLLIATEGRVETAGIGVNRWADDKLILCVSFLKNGRKHHALQLQVDDWVDQTDDHFLIYHGGRMGGRSIKSALVIDALYEACRDDLILDSDRILLGSLPRKPADVTWSQSKEFLANLLHYALIRTELREAHAYKKP